MEFNLVPRFPDLSYQIPLKSSDAVCAFIIYISCETMSNINNPPLVTWKRGMLFHQGSLIQHHDFGCGGRGMWFVG